MGLLDRLQNGIAAGAETASEAFMAQFKSQVEQERQEALVRAQELSRIRTAEAEAGIQLNTRQKSFEQDEANAGLLRARKVADETEVGTARNALERGAAKNKMADDLAFKKTNAKDIVALERQIAQARHITDPNIDLIQNGDGTYMRFDKRAGKPLGVLTDPDTGKPFVGAKDVSKANLEVAQSLAKEGLELMKDSTNPDSVKQGRALLEQSRSYIVGGQGKSKEDSVDAKTKRLFGDGKPKEEAKTPTPTTSAGRLSPAERKAAASTEVTPADIERNKQAVAAKKQREADAEAVREEERRKKNEKRDKVREAMNRLSRRSD